MDELAKEVKTCIKKTGPVSLSVLCKELRLWPKAGIKRRLQKLRQCGHVKFSPKKGWQVCSPE